MESVAVEDQMDWIGDKLAMLIEQGKKALNREIVVMSDAKEDEVDDGSPAWEEDDQERVQTPARPSSISRSSSAKRVKKPCVIAAAPASPRVYNTSHATGTFTPSASPRLFGSELLLSSPMVVPPPQQREDERSWESLELRESMERARARVLLLRSRGT